MRLALQPAGYCSAITAAEGEAIKINLWVFMQFSHPWGLNCHSSQAKQPPCQAFKWPLSFPSAAGPLRWASFVFLASYALMPQAPQERRKDTCPTWHYVQAVPYSSVLSDFIPQYSNFSILSAVAQVFSSSKSFAVHSSAMQLFFIHHIKILLSLFTPAVFAQNRNRLGQSYWIH